MKWEHRLFQSGLDREDQVVQEALNQFGQGGMGACLGLIRSGFRVFVLKRPIASPPT